MTKEEFEKKYSSTLLTRDEFLRRCGGLVNAEAFYQDYVNEYVKYKVNEGLNEHRKTVKNQESN